MIKSKEDLKKYLECDRINLGKNACKEVVKYQIALRKKEYYNNCKKYSLGWMFWSYRFKKYSIKLGFDIPLNVFEEGLNIHHYGCLVVNSTARIGKNCNLQQMVTIGMNHFGKAATIGDNVFIGTGAKIIGNVTIADGCIIGANAVVTKDFLEKNSIIAGVPAKVIGKKDNNDIDK